MLPFRKKKTPEDPDAGRPRSKNKFLSARGWKETFSRTPSPSRAPSPNQAPSVSQSSTSVPLQPVLPVVGLQPVVQPTSQSTTSPFLSGSSLAVTVSTPMAGPPVGPVTAATPDRNPTLWEKAIGSLTETDRKEFNVTDPDPLKTLAAVLKATEQVKDACYQKMWKFQWRGEDVVLRDVADKTIVWINKFKAMGNMISQCDPVHLAIPWAPIKYLMEIAAKDSEKYGSMIVGIEMVTNLLGRCAIYEELYPGSTRIKAELVSLYAKILTYLITAKRFYSVNTTVRTVDGFLDGSEHLEELMKIDEQLQRLCRETDIGEAQAQVSRHVELKALVEEFRVPIVRMEQNLQVLLDGLEDTTRYEICGWLSDIPHSRYHRTAKASRKKGTCQWLFKTPKFQAWQMTSASSILWLRGDPGAGKTKLTSTVVDLVLENQKIPGSSEALAYFYCKQGEAQLSEPEAILRSLGRQLSTKVTGPGLQKPTITAFENSRTKGKYDDGLGIEECVSLIVELVNLNLQTTIVIDALDECNSHTRHNLFRALRTIIKTSTSLVKIFLSSRNDDDIELQFGGEPNISIDVTDSVADIELYVREEVERCIKEKRLLRGKIDDTLKELVISTLISKAGGMFLWVELQIKAICNVRLASEASSMLDHLPKTLVATFEEIYRRIQCQEGLSPTIATRVLMWVMCALEPLSPNELSTMISRSVGVGLAMDDLLPMCHNLVKIDEALNVVRFFHLSVADFLASEPWFTVLEANTMASEFCLTMLNNPSEFGYIERYLILHWPFHLQRCTGQNINHPVWLMLKAFFGCFGNPSRAYCAWKVIFLRINRRSVSQILQGWLDLINKDTLPPITAAHFGFFEQISDSWDPTTWDINLTGSSGESVLYIAIKHPTGVQMLLDMGVNVNALGGEYGSALQAAAFNGYQTVVQILLDRGADINARSIYYGNTLLAAAFNGHQTVVQLLLDRGADINAQSYPYGNALLVAALNGHQMVVQLLIDRGADINAQSKKYGGALQAAAFNGYQTVVQLLLDRGADINGGDVSNRTALQQAALNGDRTVVQLLLDRGADINAGDVFNRTALQQAALNGHQTVVQLLLDRGADINTQSYDHGNALQAAAFNGYQTVVQLLLDRGADINAWDVVNRTALQQAASNGHQTVVQLLLDRGADIDAQSSYYGNALLAAALHGHLTVVLLLLKRGADINAEGGIQRTALLEAAPEGHQMVVQVLLNNGADRRYFGGALQEATRRGYVEVAKILLDNGATLEAGMADD